MTMHVLAFSGTLIIDSSDISQALAIRMLG